jgi:hypothetical protein
MTTKRVKLLAAFTGLWMTFFPYGKVMYTTVTHTAPPVATMGVY